MKWLINLISPEKEKLQKNNSRNHKRNSREPVTGERWEFIREDESPWDYDRRPHVVDILDVKCGWVRYSLGEIFNDNRLEIEIFTKIYRKVN